MLHCLAVLLQVACGSAVWPPGHRHVGDNQPSSGASPVWNSRGATRCRHRRRSGIRQVDYPFSQLVPTHMGMATMKDVRMTRWYLEHGTNSSARRRHAQECATARPRCAWMPTWPSGNPVARRRSEEAFLGTPPESPDAWRTSLTGLGTRSVSIRSGDEAAYAGRLGGSLTGERKAGWSAAKLETAQSVAEELAETSGKLDKLEAGLTKGNPALFLQKIRDMRRSMASFISAEDGPKWAELEERALRLVRNGANVPNRCPPVYRGRKGQAQRGHEKRCCCSAKGTDHPWRRGGSRRLWPSATRP